MKQRAKINEKDRRKEEKQKKIDEEHEEKERNTKFGRKEKENLS